MIMTPELQLNKYIQFMKSVIGFYYDKTTERFISSVVSNLRLYHKLYENGDILFYIVYEKSSLRIEILIKDPKNFRQENILMRILDYEKIWESDKYLLYSDIESEKSLINQSSIDKRFSL